MLQSGHGSSSTSSLSCRTSFCQQGLLSDPKGPSTNTRSILDFHMNHGSHGLMSIPLDTLVARNVRHGNREHYCRQDQVVLEF